MADSIDAPRRRRPRLGFLGCAAVLCASSHPVLGQTNVDPKGGTRPPAPTIASVDGGVEAAIDAPWRLEPDLAGPVRYPIIPIVISIHDANLQQDAETAVPLGRFCELAIREEPVSGPWGPTTFRSGHTLDEIERSDGWPPNGDVADNQRRCRPASGEDCSADLDIGSSGEWNATVLYVPQVQTPGADVHLHVQARVARAHEDCGDPKQIALDFPPFDRLGVYPTPRDVNSLIVVNRLTVHLGEEPLPRFDDGWVYGDVHYHSQGTDNEGESAYAYRPTLQAMRAMGLDFLFATDHASNSVQITDIDIVYLRLHVDLPDWFPWEETIEDFLDRIPLGVVNHADAARDMSPQRFATLLGQLNGPDGGNAQLMQFPGRRGTARLFLGGEVDVIPEMSPPERSSGLIAFGNGLTYDWRQACTPAGFTYLEYAKGLTNTDLCDTTDKLAKEASEGGRFEVKDLQGLSDSYFARQHLLHLPVDPHRADAFVSSSTETFGGATRRLGPAVAAPGDEDILQSVLYRDYAVEQKGYAFLAHPVDFSSGAGLGRLGPDMVPYSDVQLKTAFGSPYVLGLELWNEDSRLRSSEALSASFPGFPLTVLDASGAAGSRWLWGKWAGPAPASDYAALHHGLFAWDKMLLWGIRRSQTVSLPWLPAGEPRRVFMSGGSDAHGDLNYRREGRLEGVSAIVDTAIGKPRNLLNVGPQRPETVVDAQGNAYGALGQQQVTAALASGEFSVTDGPALRIVLNANANDTVDAGDLPMGAVSHIPSRGAYVSFIVEWKSTPEFGPVSGIDLYVGAANDTLDAAVVYSAANHGIHSSQTLWGTDTEHPLIDSQGGSHRELRDGNLLDPTGRLHFDVPVAQGLSGRRRVELRANDFVVGRRRVIEPQDPVCHLVPPNCHLEDDDCDLECTEPVAGEWRFDGVSLPDRWYVRAFARTAPVAGAALCAQTDTAGAVATRSGRCIERLAFTNPIWVDNSQVPPPPPDFSITCTPAIMTVVAGGTGTGTCTVRSINAFASPVQLGCTGLPSPAACHFTPATVTPPANGTVTAAFSLVTGLGNSGTHLVQPRGVSGTLARITNLWLTITSPLPPPPPPGSLATFDPRRGAPSCGDRSVGSSCDTGTLVTGRGPGGISGGAEANAPNTIAASCLDGAAYPRSGPFGSNDRIKVSTLGGGAFAPGQAVRIDAVVTVPATPSQYAVDFFYATNAAQPSWTLIETVVPGAAGTQTLSTRYAMAAGALQAVRVQLRLAGAGGSCAPGDQNDRDDLIFAVGP